MNRLPSVLFVIDVKKEEIAVSEGRRLGIPIVGICDTNSDPEKIEYPVPGNDDALRSIRFFASFVADTVLEVRTTSLEGADAVEPVEPAIAATGGESGEATPQAQ